MARINEVRAMLDDMVEDHCFAREQNSIPLSVSLRSSNLLF